MDSETRRGILCAGNIVHDTLVRPVDRLAWGTTTWVDEIHSTLGGNGAATSFTLGKLGVPVRLLSMAGGDSLGDALLRRLESAGVDVSYVTRSEAPTPATIALVHPGGDRLFLHRPGASEFAFREPIEFSSGVLRGISYFHLANVFALPLLRPRAADTLRRARSAGLITTLDTGWDALGRWMEDLGECLPFVDVLFVNQSEARMLSGQTSVPDAAAALRGRGAGRVVVKLGAQGCAVYAAGKEFRVPAFPVEVVDTTGAGDCFAGGYLAALARGLSHESAARYANAAGALSASRLGGADGIVPWDEMERWMEFRGGSRG